MAFGPAANGYAPGPAVRAPEQAAPPLTGKTVRLDFRALRQNGLITPDNMTSAISNEFRGIKRRLLQKVRAGVEQYLGEIEKGQSRHHLTGYAFVGVQYQSNANVAGSSQILTPIPIFGPALITLNAPFTKQAMSPSRPI